MDEFMKRWKLVNSEDEDKDYEGIQLQDAVQCTKYNSLQDN